MKTYNWKRRRRHSPSVKSWARCRYWEMRCEATHRRCCLISSLQTPDEPFVPHGRSEIEHQGNGREPCALGDLTSGRRKILRRE